jgi:phage baseplate assembly protein gpV
MVKGLVGEDMLYAQSENLTTSAGAAAQGSFHRNMLDGLWDQAPRPQIANVHVIGRHRDGTIFYDKWVHNLRTNAGINWQYNQMAGTTAAVALYIALSSDTTAPAAGDTTVAGEITDTFGLARALGTASHSSNATSYTVAKTFTATGSYTAVQKAGLFNASSGVTLVFENTFSSVNMNSGDTLAVTWTINF